MMCAAKLPPLAGQRPVKRQTTPSLVADVLRDAILSGVLKAGQVLPQDEIAAQFGLSRIPVREALRQLEGEGWVTLAPHRRAVVSMLSYKELREIVEIRVALESTALRLAIPHLSADDLARADEILTITDRDSEVAAHWSEHNWTFHAALYAPADRPRLLSMSKSLHDNIDRYLRMYRFILDDYKATGQREHRAILDACARRDVEGAVALLGRHIGGVSDLLAAYLHPAAEAEPVP